MPDWGWDDASSCGVEMWVEWVILAWEELARPRDSGGSGQHDWPLAQVVVVVDEVQVLSHLAQRRHSNGLAVVTRLPVDSLLHVVVGGLDVVVDFLRVQLLGIHDLFLVVRANRGHII
jgi:hypothetical protein